MGAADDPPLQEVQQVQQEEDQRMGKKPRLEATNSTGDCSNTVVVKADTAITLHLVEPTSGQVRFSFAPAFTHQFFEDEEIRGYQSPHINIYVREDSARWAASLSYMGREPTVKDDEALVEHLKKGLPPDTVVQVLEEDIPRDRPGKLVAPWVLQQLLSPERQSPLASRTCTPQGVEVEAYSLDGEDEESEQYAIYLASPEQQPDCVDFHNTAQKLAPWFIENGDDVDLKDGLWEVLYLYHLPSSSSSSSSSSSQSQGQGQEAAPSPRFVGYLTVYGFNNPMKGTGLRVCQVLILPPYQRKGHGSRLLKAVYRLARSRGNVFEVTVEDPCPSCTLLRNVTDIRDAANWQGQPGGVFGSDLMASDSFTCLTEADKRRVQKEMKLTKAQVTLCYECLKLVPVAQQVPREYRLMVKKRLSKELMPQALPGQDLSLPSSKEAFQRELDRVYQEVEADYRYLLSKAKLTN